MTWRWGGLRVLETPEPDVTIELDLPDGSVLAIAGLPPEVAAELIRRWDKVGREEPDDQER